MVWPTVLQAVGAGTILAGASASWNSALSMVSRWWHPTGIDFLRDKGPEVAATAFGNVLAKQALDQTDFMSDSIDMVSAAVLTHLLKE